jgi:hypothetical protein
MTTINLPGLPCCPYCGCYHTTPTCGRVKAIEYYPNGTIKRVELHDIATYYDTTPVSLSVTTTGLPPGC